MDWMPDKRAERYLWWKNLSDHIADEGAKVGLSDEDILAIQALADDQVARMEATDAAKSALDGARAAEAAVTKANDAAIRARVRNVKTLPLYPGSGVEGVLKLKGQLPAFDADAHKPGLKVSLVGGQIQVDVTKGRCNGVAIYSRLRGTAAWTRLGVVTKSPFIDTRPLADPAAPEVREYMARGVIDDVEIGQSSDIVSFTLI
jgi:hypothetical protein